MFRIGDLVWAKMKGFPAWPARISEPKKGNKKLHRFVYFFGTKDYAWIPDDQISHHSDAMLATIANRKMTATLKAAVQEITEEAAKDDGQRRPMSEEDSTMQVEEERSPEPSIKTKLALKYKRLKDSKKSKVPKRRFFGGKKRPRAVIPPYDDDPPSQDPKISHVPPTDKRIGFLGLGAMGQSIVRNLIKSGHKVTVWNRSPDKCDEFVKSGALKGAHPADVVAACDITFCCVSDPEVSKIIVFSSVGVLRGLERSSGSSVKKGYVELTSLDDQTSQEISEAVQFEGGRYLEAQMSSSTRQMAHEGDLSIMGAGDIELFRACETVFHAISKHAYFVSPDVGVAANLSLAVSSLCGASCAAIGETLALADRFGICRKDMLDVSRMVGFGCPLADDKLVMDHHRQKPLTVSVRNQQKDLHLTMQISDTRNQPMPVVAAANELFKHAKRLGYRNKDSSAIYLATKF